MKQVMKGGWMSTNSDFEDDEIPVWDHSSVDINDSTDGFDLEELSLLNGCYEIAKQFIGGNFEVEGEELGCYTTKGIDGEVFHTNILKMKDYPEYIVEVTIRCSDNKPISVDISHGEFLRPKISMIPPSGFGVLAEE